jgi:serine/threonine protein kinase
VCRLVLSQPTWLPAGAFSEIYVAADTLSDANELVAIKFQNEDFDSSVMKWESIVMQDLADIPSVPRMVYYGQENGRDFMVMELLTGEDMANLRDRIRLSTGSEHIPIEIASYLTRQMIVSLQAMHLKGYVHRDVKPSNFMRRSGASTEFCVIDFGLAKRVSYTRCKRVCIKHISAYRFRTILCSNSTLTVKYVRKGRPQNSAGQPSMRLPSCTLATTSARATIYFRLFTYFWTLCWGICRGEHTRATRIKQRWAL